MTPLAISNIAWRPEENELIYSILAEAGVRGIEIAPGLAFREAPDPLRPTQAEIADFRRQLAAYGLQPVSMQSLLFGASKARLFGDPTARAAFKTALRHAIALAERLEIPNVVMGSPGNRAVPAEMDRIRAAEIACALFRKLGDRAQAAGTKLALEPNPAAYGTNFLTTMDETIKFAAFVDHPAVAVNFDLGAMHMSGEIETADVFCRRGALKASHVHVSEPNLAPAPEREIEFGAIARDLIRHGYRGWFSIEMRQIGEDNRENVRGRSPRLRPSTSSGCGMTEASQCKEEFLVSLCFAAEGDTEGEINKLSVFAGDFDRSFRYWEIVYVLGEGERVRLSCFAQVLSRIRNLRIIVVRDNANFYRRRAVAASEAIGDVIALTAFGEAGFLDLAALVGRAFASGEIILGRRKSQLTFSPAHWLLTLLTSHRIDGNDLQTIVLPRARLNELALRSTFVVDLRFQPKTGGDRYTRELVGIGKLKPPQSRVAARFELLEELISTSAPRMLRAYAAVSVGVTFLASLYGLYAVCIVLFKPDVQKGWFSTALVQSGSVAFIAIGMTVIAVGLAGVAQRWPGRSRNDEIVDEIANINFFDRCTSPNVVLSASERTVTEADGDIPDPRIAERGWSVPAFRQDVFRPKATRYVTVIPVLNEGHRIQNELRCINALGLTSRTDVVIVDGGSTDGSLASDLLKATGVRALLTKTGPGKLSAQLRCGYAWALLEGYAGIVTIDGNGKDGVESIPAFLRGLDEGFGYVQASRFIRGGHSENTPLLRLLAIRLIHAPSLSIAAGTALTDTTQGYRAYSAAFLSDPRTQPFRDVFMGYELLAYLTTRASQIGYRVKEIPTSRVYPKGEPVPTKIRSIRSLLDLLIVMLKALFRAYHPKSL